MSVEPGQYGAYTPPPPPAARRSPWLWVALGCGGAVLLGFVGCASISAVFMNRMKTEMAKPLDKSAIMKGLKDTPLYPGATLDENGTKGAHVGIGLFKGMGGKAGEVINSMEVAAFKTPDSSDKILAWYDTTLTSKGFKPVRSQQSPVSGGEQRSYLRGNDIVMVQIPQTSSGVSFILTRSMAGKNKGAGADAEPAAK